MEGEVARQFGVDDGQVSTLGGGVGWVDGFHAHVEAKDEVVEIESESKPIRYCQLAPEPVESELGSLAGGLVVAGCPDVASIGEEGSAEFPEEVGAQLYAGEQLEVAGLIDEVDLAVLAHIVAGAEFSHRPSAHTVGSAAEIPFFKWHYQAVAVRLGYAEGCMEGQGVARVDDIMLRVVEIELYVLGESYVEETVLPV